MTPAQRFVLQVRSSPVGSPFHVRLMAHRDGAEAVVGVLMFTSEEYDAFRLVADLAGIKVVDAAETV